MHLINQATIQQVILSKLEQYTGCTCVPSNTTKQMPAYPYISFSVINTRTRKGTYNKVDNVTYMPMSQVWSFTVQSDNDTEALEKAMNICDFFAEAKRIELEDNGIVVADVGQIVPRDNLLTIEYEYRKGLDVTLSLTNVIEDLTNATINNVTLTSDNVSEINLEKE